MAPRIETYDGIVFGSDGDAVVVLFVYGNTLTRSKWAWQRVNQVIARHGSAATMLIVTPGTPPPSSDARADSVEQFRRARDKIRCFITVVEGDALWLNIVRTVNRAIVFLSGLSDVSTVEATERAGLDAYLRFATPNTPSRAALEALIKQMRVQAEPFLTTRASA